MCAGRRKEIPICQPMMMPVRFPRHYGQKSYFIQVNIIRHGLSWARLSASRADVRSVRSARWNPFVWRTGGGGGAISGQAAEKAAPDRGKTVCLIEWEDTVAIRKRSSKGLLASLYEYVNLDGKKECGGGSERTGDRGGGYQGNRGSAGCSPHFSHVEWHMCGRRICLKRASGYQDKTVLMVRRAELQDRYPIPNAFRVYTNILI